ncbi:MAG TPA: TetR/AcrR family transcriptional regulator [Firmicutes bacterium]|nr:TetR/AcrR family transcriptional regulator [Bacillota bacterium]
MATAFSDQERELIKAALNEAAKDCLRQYGVRKTTVDELIHRTGISKGSFYNFYDSKEALIFHVLEEYQMSLINELLVELEESEQLGVDTFTELVYGLYQKVSDSFIMTIIKNQEFDVLMRKIPQERVDEHHLLDNLFTEQVMSFFKMKDTIKVDLVSTSLRNLFMSMVHKEEVGEENYAAALKLLIRGLALQIIEED